MHLKKFIYSNGKYIGAAFLVILVVLLQLHSYFGGKGAQNEIIVKDGISSLPLIKDGTYVVGKDIPAGEYIVFSLHNDYAAFQLKGEMMTLPEGLGLPPSLKRDRQTDTIMNVDFYDAKAKYIVVKKGERIVLSGAGAILSEKCGPLSPVDGKYDEGMYKIGRDIQPGIYSLVPFTSKDAVPNYMICNGTREDMLVVKQDYFYSEIKVDIRGGQFIRVHDCIIKI